MKTIKPRAINSCWRKLCADVIHDFTGFMIEPNKKSHERACGYGKKGGGTGFQNKDPGEIKGLRDINTRGINRR